MKSLPDWKEAGGKWSEVREYLLGIHDCSCVYCGVLVHNHTHGDLKTKATIDHVVPRSRGGIDDLSNLTLACFSCNSSKGNR